jgi:DNA recombination protein RmuC
VDGKLGETNKMVNDSVRNQFSESARLIQDINERVTKQLVDVAQKLTESKEVSKQVLGIADQLQSLQDVLKNPKQRGVLGEYYLEALLKNVLPPGSFEMQYKFSDGEIVDAAVFVKNKVIPIDSKFSLENYNRMVEERNDAEKERLGKLFENDLKLRIKETSKYIRPNENTMDFAFMFIPHEAIYYDLLTNKITSVTDESENLIQRAASKYRVIIVSPTSFLAYLQTVLQGLKALQIEETAKDIIKRVEDLNKHLKTFEQYHGKLGNALSVAVSHFNASNKEYKKIDKDVLRITGAGIGIEQVILEKPETELVE